MTFRRFAVALSFVASVALAQESVTRVDLVVTDAKGKPVRGLTAADFEIVTAGQARAVASAAEVTASPRRVLILFDNASLTLAHRRQVAAATKSWVEANMRPVDHIAVAALNPTLRQVLDWSNEKAAVIAALETASRDAGNHGEQERHRAQKLIREVIQRALETDEKSPFQPSFDEMMRVGRTYASSQWRNVQSTISSLSAAMTWFTHPSDKRVLLIAGESLPRNPGYEMFMHLNDLKMEIEMNGPALLIDTTRRASPLTEARQLDALEDLQQVRASAVARGVAVYALNPGRGRDSGGTVEHLQPADHGGDFVRTSSAMTGYELITGGTGGMAFFGVPPERALAQVASDLETSYSVSYASAVPGDSTIRAKAGHRVRSTLAAVPQPVDERMRVAVLSLQAAPPETNELAITLAADAPREAGSERLVPLRVFIPISRLRIDPDGSEVAGAFSVYIATGNGQGELSRVVKKTHAFRWPVDALQYGQGKNMTFALDVSLPAGFSVISVGVLDQRSEKTGFERVAVQ